MDSYNYKYKLDKLYTYMEGLFSFAPLKVGDRVKLNHTLNLDATDGWYGCKQFLIKNSLATVVEVDFLKDKEFSCTVVFDIESWLNGTIELPSNKHTFSFTQAHFDKVSKEEEFILKEQESNTWKAIRIFFDLQDYLVNILQVAKNDYEVCQDSNLNSLLKNPENWNIFHHYVLNNYKWATVNSQRFWKEMEHEYALHCTFFQISTLLSTQTEPIFNK